MEPLLRCVARWTIIGALCAVLATLIDFFVQVAELRGETVFAGADLATVWRFATATVVGKWCVARAIMLLGVALIVKLPGRAKWALTAFVAWGAILATSEVSHAAAQAGSRLVPIITQVAHITTPALWMGVLLHIFVARRLLMGDAGADHVKFLAAVVEKFSPFALIVTSLLGLSGIMSAVRYIPSIRALFESPYGLTLLVKMALLTPAIYAGYVNFRKIRPALQRAAENGGDVIAASGVLAWFSRMLELEVTAGVLVITVAGVLGSVSPPGGDGSQQLTAAQAHVFLQPHRPNTNIEGWQHQEDPRGITDAAMRYSEFTHNWSGVIVCLMGFSWMALSAGGRAKVWAGRFFPFVLVAFGVFIARYADPELWVLHYYTPSEALTNPILLEHQLGAAMVFIIAWLSWRDRKTPVEKQPLGYPLPIIMIAGSLLLLGHAHSLTTIPDDLTNLINTQHAVFGAFGLFAGTARLLMLRGSIPARVSRFVWPGFVVCLGIFMAFFYREMM